MLMVSVLMVLSTAIVAMTIASFKDASRTRNRAEILSVSEIGLRLAVAEIMPGLGTMPYAYWSFSPNEGNNPPLPDDLLPYASSSVQTTAIASKDAAVSPGEPGDLTHEFQVIANVRNWSPFADWTKWDPTKTTAQNLANPAWAKGWWVVPRRDVADDAYFNEDAHAGLDSDYKTQTPSAAHPNPWLYKNPTDKSKLAFPVRLGTSSVPVSNLYWYWLTETEPNTPTNLELRKSFEDFYAVKNGGSIEPYWIHDRDTLVAGKAGVGNDVPDRDVGVGAWPNHRDYDDLRDDAGLHGKKVAYEGAKTSFTFDRERYNFLNTPVLKKIYLVNHRGKPIRVAVYCRMILREYFIDSTGAKPKRADDLLLHMRQETAGGGPNVIFYLVAVNESTVNQRGKRVQQAIYVPMGPGNPQDIDATMLPGTMYGRTPQDGAMLPGVMNRLLDKQLLAGDVIKGQILPASGDLSYRIPGPILANEYLAPADHDAKRHPHWVYLIEWNGKEPMLATHSMPAAEDTISVLTRNTALIWWDRINKRWVRTPFRLPAANPKDDPAVITTLTGATPSAYADVFGKFEIGVSDTNALPLTVLANPLPRQSRWRGPAMDGWGGQRAASMSYLMTTELQIPGQQNSGPRFGRPVQATESVLPP
jgi:hypothetical protein